MFYDRVIVELCSVHIKEIDINDVLAFMNVLDGNKEKLLIAIKK